MTDYAFSCFCAALVWCDVVRWCGVMICCSCWVLCVRSCSCAHELEGTCMCERPSEVLPPIPGPVLRQPRRPLFGQWHVKRPKKKIGYHCGRHRHCQCCRCFRLFFEVWRRCRSYTSVVGRRKFQVLRVPEAEEGVFVSR